MTVMSESASLGEIRASSLTMETMSSRGGQHSPLDACNVLKVNTVGGLSLNIEYFVHRPAQEARCSPHVDG